MSTQMIIRVEPVLKDKVNVLAKAEGKTTSEVVRELLEEYVRERDMGAYIDDLWNPWVENYHPGALVSQIFAEQSDE